MSADVWIFGFRNFFRITKIVNLTWLFFSLCVLGKTDHFTRFSSCSSDVRVGCHRLPKLVSLANGNDVWLPVSLWYVSFFLIFFVPWNSMLKVLIMENMLTLIICKHVSFKAELQDSELDNFDFRREKWWCSRAWCMWSGVLIHAIRKAPGKASRKATERRREGLQHSPVEGFVQATNMQVTQGQRL